MNIIKQYGQRYLRGWQQLNFLWKAGVIVTAVGMIGLLLSIWLTPAASINAPSAVLQRNVLIALVAVGLLLRIAGAVVLTKRTFMRRNRR